MTRRALVIGNDYVGTQAELAGCVNDARAWGAYLAARGFGVRTLFDAPAAGILSALTALVSASKAGDVLVWSYSGHGTNLRDDDGDELDGRDEAIVGADLTALRDDALGVALSALPAGVAFTAILDSCYSGTATRLYGGARPGTPRYLPSRDVVDVVQPAATRAAALPVAFRWAQLSACRDTEVALESPNPDGTVSGDFTRAALRTLRASGSALTLGGLVTRVRGQITEQTPTLDAPAGYERRTLVSRVPL